MKTVNLIIVLLALIISSPIYGQLRRANKQFELYRFAKAIPLYEKAVQSKNEAHRKEATARLADCYRITNDVKNAIVWYQKAVQYNDNESINYYYLGQALRSSGQYDKAADAFKKYARLVPSDIRGSKFAEYCTLVQEWEKYAQQIEVKNAEPINSTASDFSPVFYKNGIVYASDRIKQASEAERFSWTNRNFVNLYYAEPLFYNDFWNEILGNMDVPGYKNQMTHDGPAFFSKNGDQVFVTRTKLRKANRRKGSIMTNRLKVYQAEMNSSEKQKFVPFFLNSDTYSVAHPVLTSDLSKIIFSSDMPGGNGGMDLYYCNWENGKWSSPINFGPNINTFGNEVFPYLANDSLLFFSSDGLPGYGGLDIFRTSFTKEGKTSIPENLYKPFNSSYDDFGLIFNSDLVSGFFSSSRPGGLGSDDIYAFRGFKEQLIAAKEPKLNIPQLSGFVKDKQTLKPIENAMVFLLNTKTNKVKVLKTDSTGNFKTPIDKDVVYLAKGTKKNFIQDCVQFRFTENDTAMNLSLPRALLLDKLEVDRIFRIDNIYYDFDKWEIRPDAAVELNKLVQIMNENPITIELSSHTDSRGTNLYNFRLSQNRAESAVYYIINQGISANRLFARGYGESKLTNRCSDGVQCTDAEHQANRRTEFKILSIEGSSPSNIELLSLLKDGDEIMVNVLPEGFFNSCATAPSSNSEDTSNQIAKPATDTTINLRNEAILTNSKVEKVVTEPSSETNNQNNVLKDAANSKQNNSSSEESNCFGVQIRASKKPLNIEELRLKVDLLPREYYDGNWYRYVVGCENSLDSAKKTAVKVRSGAFSDAFTVNVTNGIVKPAM
ncbi:MAG: OmpA family protein [Bacteroidales bacterium]|nr:OmpA family protein [Bacteroidales bacterium]